MSHPGCGPSIFLYKLILVNFTLLSDIDNGKASSEWGATFVIHHDLYTFSIFGLVVSCFSFEQPTFSFYQNLVAR